MMRRFYAPPDNFSERQITLGLEETRHLRDVLRLRTGENVRVFDGEGREFRCAVDRIGKKETSLIVLEEIVPAAPESALDLTLAVALLKGEKFELVIQKAVELGVTRFVPLITKRTDVKINDPSKKMERWQKIVPEASKQCGRAKLMNIETPVEFDKFLAGRATDEFILFSERDGERLSDLSTNGSLSAIIGPEGGWDDSEIILARQNGVKIVTLGGRILRAETAVITISALLQNHFGDLN